MTRIIGGSAGGRRLVTPRGDRTRPTTDRVREALFSAIESWCGSLSGLRVLDLYAGSGAIGLEAWSRGAAQVTLVERDRRTAALIATNAEALGCRVAHVVAQSVASYLAALASGDDEIGAREPVDLVYLDPPYGLQETAVASDLAALAAEGVLAPGALVVVERGTRTPEPVWPAGLIPERSRTYGETVLWYGHRAEE